MNTAVDRTLGNLGLDDSHPAIENDLMSRLDNAAIQPQGGLVEVPVPIPQATQEQWTPPEDKKKKEKPQTPYVSPDLRKMGPLGKMLPGSETVRVHKRMESGVNALVGEFNDNDLIGCVDMESYLYKHVVPKRGGGEYLLTGITSKGQMIPGGTLNLLGAPEVKQDASLVDLMQNVLQRQEANQREYMRMMTQPAANPVTMLKDMMEVQKEFTGDAGKGDLGSVVQAISAQGSSSMHAVMQMMLAQQQAQQQSQQQQMQMMMAMMGQPKTDPITMALLQKLAEKKDDPMPPPPMPPQADPLEALERILSITAKLQPQPDPDRLTTREMIELFRGGQPTSGNSEFETIVRNTNTLLGLANNLKQQSEPSAGAGFFDALGSLFGNREFVGALAGGARAKLQQSAGGAPQQQQAQVPPQVVQAFRQLEARNKMLEQQLRALSAQVPPKAVASTPAPAPAPAPAETQDVVDTVAEPAAPAEVQQPVRVAPEIPQDILDAIHEIELAVKATDDTKIVEGLIDLIITIEESDEEFWKQLSIHLMKALEDNDKDTALSYVSAFFEALKSRSLLGDGTFEKVVSIADEHFEMIAEEVLKD